MLLLFAASLATPVQARRAGFLLFLGAIGLMVAANVLFAFNDVWLRRIADDIGIIQTIWGRSVLFLAIMLTTMRRADWNAALTTHKPHLQIIRGCFPVIGAVLMIAAMGAIPVADATAMFFLSPLLASLLAMPLLREKMTRERWLALALGLGGMLVIVRPGASVFQWGHVWALTCAGVIAATSASRALLTAWPRPPARPPPPSPRRGCRSLPAC